MTSAQSGVVQVCPPGNCHQQLPFERETPQAADYFRYGEARLSDVVAHALHSRMIPARVNEISHPAGYKSASHSYCWWSRQRARVYASWYDLLVSTLSFRRQNF